MNEDQWVVGASAAIFRIKETGQCFVPKKPYSQPQDAIIELLLTRRTNYGSYPRCLTCPGGRPNYSTESPLDVVVREVSEEIGLKFSPTSLFSHPTSSWFSSDGKMGYMTNLYFGEWSGEAIIQKEEVSSYSWYSYRDLLQEKMAFDYSRIIEYMHKVNVF